MVTAARIPDDAGPTRRWRGDCPGASTASERRMLELWERLLETRPIGIHDSFFACGGTPALYARLLTDIRHAFGLLAEGLPVGEIREKPTIAALAAMIDANSRPAPALVTCLQPPASGRPLFLVHGGGGYVFFYRALAARLAPQCAVYAVRAETADDRRGRPFTQAQSVEEIAERYLAEIRTVQPEGPYLLGGGSFGGVAAFEMARQLRSSGEQVGAVFLFSAFLWNTAADDGAGVVWVKSGAAPLQRRIASQLAHASELPAGAAIRFVSEKVLTNVASEAAAGIRHLRRGIGGIATDIADEITRTHERTRGRQVPPALTFRCAANLRTGNRLLARYVPRPHDGPIVLFRAAADDDPSRGWSRVAQGGMVVHDMPGGHLDMMEEPVVATTANLVLAHV